MAFLALFLDPHDYTRVPGLRQEAAIRRHRREVREQWSLDRLAQQYELLVAEAREAVAQGGHPILDRTEVGPLLGRFMGVTAWVDDHVKTGTTSHMLSLSMNPGFTWTPPTVIDWAQRLKRDMRRLRPEQAAVAHAGLVSVHALMDGRDMLNQRLGEEELSRAVHAQVIQRGVLDAARSAEAVRAADRTVPLTTRAAEALLESTGWDAGRLSRLKVQDIALRGDGQTIELGEKSPGGPVRRHVGWRTGALLAALTADRPGDEALLSTRTL